VSSGALKKASAQKRDLVTRVQRLFGTALPPSSPSYTIDRMTNLRKAIALGFGEQICLYQKETVGGRG
jgi:hypothetical protein